MHQVDFDKDIQLSRYSHDPTFFFTFKRALDDAKVASNKKE
ncbi:hypothetical protein Lp19_1180 [Lactiplantibacillus plantarum]|uniref:Uncharacterized protein n=1 Tax=Lactiplantibacillus plantarum TaxID=1590 RepID=A0A165RVD5_LACPN|nr:hypothetical protein Lp19_1180 [Lactiplantibacillus plantarum]